MSLDVKHQGHNADSRRSVDWLCRLYLRKSSTEIFNLNAVSHYAPGCPALVRFDGTRFKENSAIFSVTCAEKNVVDEKHALRMGEERISSERCETSNPPSTI